MSSSLSTEATPRIPFAPTAETLDRALALISAEGERTASAVPPEARRAAFARYEALPVPGTRPARTWRHDYTKLPFAGLEWSCASAQDGLVRLGADPRAVVLPPADAGRSCEPDDAAFAGDKFAQLAIAFQNCGAFVSVPAGVVLDAPIVVELSSAAEGETAPALFPHIVVVLGAGARATVVERHRGGGAPFVCGIVSAQLADGAELDYAVVQDASPQARLLFHRTGRTGANAALRWHVAELGGALSRSVAATQLDAAGAQGQTDALFFNTGRQHVDLTTTTDHAVGETTSQTIVRTAAADDGQGRFFGNIVIERDAHGADASLRDDALLLARKAHIESVPALEIAANDVKAYHGATVGSLDEETLFYAQSRGLDRASAVRMVALAFFEPALSRFPGEALREELRAALGLKIDAAGEIGT